MTRTNAREIAVHLIYELFYTDATAQEVVNARMNENYYPSLAEVDELYAQRPEDRELEYIRTLVSGVREKQSELDCYIEKYSNNWKLNRISRISRAIMETAMYEILFVDDVPTGVAINEAVSLCKHYEEEKTVAFVNGILGNFAREVAADVPGV